MKKNIVRISLAALGAFLMLNGLIMIIFANANIGSWLTALLGLCFVLPTVFVKSVKAIIEWNVFKFIFAFVGFLIVSAVVVSVILFFYGNIKTVTYKENYLMILGCGVRGETPTAPLVSRLDTALEYCERNKDCKIIVTGGQGNGEDITEAEAMRRYLVEHGIDNERIIKEEESTSTNENFKFSNRLVDGGLASQSVAFITNDFHIYRANSLARYQGFKMNYLGAPTKWYDIVPSYMRELLAIVQMFVFNK